MSDASTAQFVLQPELEQMLQLIAKAKNVAYVAPTVKPTEESH